MTLRTRGLLMAALGTTAWSTTPLFYQYLLERYASLQPSTIVFWRNLLAGMMLSVILAVFRRPSLMIQRRDIPFLMLYGFVGLALVNGLWGYSTKYNGAAVGTLLAYCSTAFTVLLAWLILGEALGVRRIAAVALALAGAALVVEAFRPSAWQFNLVGLAVGLATGLAFSVFNLLGRWSANRFDSVWTLLAYGLLFSSLALGLTQTPQTAFSLGRAWTAWAVIVFIAIGPTLVSFGLYTSSLRILPAGVVSVIASLELVITALLATLLLGTRLTAWQWLGAGLTLGAVFLVQGEAAPATKGATDARREI
jgi:DME family drug/metabolite transporter